MKWFLILALTLAVSSHAQERSLDVDSINPQHLDSDGVAARRLVERGGKVRRNDNGNVVVYLTEVCDQITADDLNRINDLEELFLFGEAKRDCLVRLTPRKRLKVLEIHAIGDEAIPLLSKFPNVEELSVFDLKEFAFEKMPVFSKLKYLELDLVEFDENALDFVLSNKRIVDLSAESLGDLSEEQLKHLVESRKWESLYLGGKFFVKPKEGANQ